MKYKILVDGFCIERIEVVEKLSAIDLSNIAYAWAKDRNISPNGVRIV